VVCLKLDVRANLGDAPLLKLVLLYATKQQKLSVAVMAVW
jgi:hypothetical protein